MPDPGTSQDAAPTPAGQSAVAPDGGASGERIRAVVASGPARLDDVCSPACRELITRHFDPVWNDGPELTSDRLAELIAGDRPTVLLTSWGTPPLTAEALAGAPGLLAVAHAAGTVRSLVPAAAYDRGVAVFSAAPRIAESVAEYCLAATLTLLRRLPELDAEMRTGTWRGRGLRGRELTGARIGIIGASSTARAFLRLLAPFRVRAAVYDPYLSADDARALGVRLAPLEEVAACDIVSVHAPATPETTGLLDRAALARIPDGGILVNSSRGLVVDQDALLDELRAGRISAALDVFDPEPPALPADLRAAPNVLLSPHVAGNTAEGHLALLEYVVRDLVGWLADGSSGPSRVDPSRAAITA